MSALSDPDRLERLAQYVQDDPPNATATEVAIALDDAAERIRSLQARLEESIRHVGRRFEQARSVISQMQGVIDEYERRLDQATTDANPSQILSSRPATEDLCTSLTIDNILESEVGKALDALREAGFAVEVNVSRQESTVLP